MCRTVLIPGLCLSVLLAGCGPSARRAPQPRGAPVLRAVYRDAGHHLLVALRDGPGRLPTGDCAAPLLVNDATGAVQQISRAEAERWMARMQLAGAMHGTCP